MAKNSSVTCDIKGCKNSKELERKAGDLVGWMSRTVIDAYEKNLVTGVQKFTASTTFYLCPDHSEHGERLPSPPTHPEVIQFKHQEEPNLTQKT